MVIIIRLKLHNLQEEDVDIRNLCKDLSDASKGSFRPLVHMFDLDSKASDSVIEEIMDEIAELVLLDAQLYLDNNIYNV